MKRKTWTQIFLHLILIVGLVIVVLPMVYMISTSLKPNGALYEYPATIFTFIRRSDFRKL